MTQARRAVAILLTAGLSLGLVGCGGSEPKAQQPASESPSSTSPSPSESESASPSASPTQRPLSRYEDTPQVKVARKWASAVGRAINAGDPNLRAVGRYSTAFGMSRFPDNAREDQGTYFPGPQPFTPIGVSKGSTTSVVRTCWWSDGWGQNKKTKLPARKRNIIGIDMAMRKVGGQWKVNQLLVAKRDCSAVRVKGIAW